MVLLRHLLGDALRRLRLRQGRTLREVSASARVSLGYLSEVERGQKEASSELLAAICSALNTPLSQVLREVSDNFALAELQVEPVFADVMGPAIEVAGVGHGSGREDGADEQVPVRGQAAPTARLHGPVAPRVPVGAGAGGRMPGLRQGQLRPGQKIAVPAKSRLPIGAGLPGTVLPATVLPVADPAFDQVSRTVREITSMVPV